MDCIFCKIAYGEIPARKLYEDSNFCVFLDQYPASPGHTLVIPKSHHENIFEIPEELVAGVHSLAKRVAVSMREALNSKDVNILQNNGIIAGQTIFHYHVHVIPRYENDNITMKWAPHSDTKAEELNTLLKAMLGVFR